MPAANAPPPPAPKPSGSRPAGPPPRPGRSLAWLNAILAGLFLAVIAGPALVRWVAPPGRSAPAAPTPAPELPAAGEDATRPEIPLPGAEAAPARPAEGPDGTLRREAHALYEAGRVAEACQRYRELAARGSATDARRDLGACLARLGRDAYQAGQLQAAGEFYEQAVAAHPVARDHWTAWVITLVKAGQPARAHQVLGQALAAFPDDPELLYLLADVQERQGRTREAADTLRRLLAAHPGHARGRSLLVALEREQKVEGSYWTQESRHFLVRYEGAQGIDLGRSVVDTLEAAYESIGRDLGAFPADRVQVGIYQTQVLGQVIGVPAHYIRGAFDGKKLRLNLAESVAYSNDLERLVRHEYAHLVIHLASAGRAPIWVHEGLAQVMEPRPAPRTMEISVPREYLTLRGIERLGRTMDPMAFTAGYELMHIAAEFLVDRGGLARVRDFLARLGRGEEVPEALRQAFGFGPDEVEARLLAAGGRS